MRGEQLFAGPTGDYCRRTSVDLKVHCYSNPVDSESWLAQEHAQLPCSNSTSELCSTGLNNMASYKSELPAEHGD